MINEVTVFSHGDSRSPKSWSNIPYFFTKTLEEKGVKVNRVNIHPNIKLDKYYNRFVWKPLKKIQSDYFITYLHSQINFWLVQRQIKKACRQYKNSQGNIFLTFSHTAAGYTPIPSVLICDWTIKYYFEYFMGRAPGFLERPSINRQKKVIQRSELVVSLFPSIAEYMQTDYLDANIQYYGHVINSDEKPDRERLLEKKRNSKQILFIGDKKYLSGAKQLIEAYRRLKPSIPELELNIIGLKKGRFKDLPEDVNCFGYLDKNDPEQKQTFYRLIENARVIVNTTEKWGAFSSMVEAMYFYTPVITTAYKEFVTCFGEDIGCGYYLPNTLETDAIQQLANTLEKVCITDSPDNDESYESLCIDAHKAVEEFTWDRFVTKFLAGLQELKK